MSRIQPIALALLSLLIAGAAQAAGTTVYRCGPEGRELRDRPCPDAPSASERVRTAEPSPQDAARARARAQHERQEADRASLARERFEASGGTRPGVLGAPAQPASRPAASQKSKAQRAPKTPKYLAPASAPSSGHP